MVALPGRKAYRGGCIPHPPTSWRLFSKPKFLENWRFGTGAFFSGFIPTAGLYSLKPETDLVIYGGKTVFGRVCHSAGGVREMVIRVTEHIGNNRTLQQE